MSVKYFLDTNVFVYSFDARTADKQAKAQELIERALADGLGIISSQVIQEFFNVASRKFEKPLSEEDAVQYLEEVFEPLCQVFPSVDLYRATLNVQRHAGISFYDALIVASASAGGCRILYSEDLQEGRRFLGLTVRNPF